jgi:hypothetical protein
MFLYLYKIGVLLKRFASRVHTHTHTQTPSSALHAHTHVQKRCTADLRESAFEYTITCKSALKVDDLVLRSNVLFRTRALVEKIHDVPVHVSIRQHTPYVGITAACTTVYGV